MSQKAQYPVGSKVISLRAIDGIIHHGNEYGNLPYGVEGEVAYYTEDGRAVFDFGIHHIHTFDHPESVVVLKSRRHFNIKPTDMIVCIIPETVITPDILSALRVGSNAWELRVEWYKGKMLLAHNNICVLLHAMHTLGVMGVKFNGCTCESGGPFLEIVEALNKYPDEVQTWSN